MPLDLLAPELIHEIAASLPHKRDLKNLSCVCKSVNYAIRPLVFSSIEISGITDSTQHLKRKMEFLERLSGANTFAPYVRTLEIGNLEPLNSPRRISKRIAKRKRIAKPNPDEVTMYECAMNFKRYFRRALESLVNVRHVVWTVYTMDDPPWTHGDIVDCLSRMQFLSDLTIWSLCDDDFTIPIQDLKCSNLVRVKFVGWDFSDPNLATATSMLIARNAPSLRSLCLHFNDEQETFESSLKQASFPILLCLRVLELGDLNISEIPAGIDLRTLERLQVTQLSDEGWQALAAAHTRLRHLWVGNVTEAFLSYLASYEGGVENIMFTACFHPESDARLSAYFYQSVLPKHAATLRSISIVGVVESNSGWVHKSDTDLVFGRCRLLEQLTVDVNFEEIDFDSPTDVVASSLRFAVAHPTLTEMRLNAVTHHMPLSFRELLVEQMTRDAILKKRFPGSINRDLQVDIGPRLSFKLQAGSDRFTEKRDPILSKRRGIDI